jgi:hypothetical protein
MIKYCKNDDCGLPFNALTAREKFCGKCRRTGAAYYKKKLAVIKTCPVCKEKFETHRSNKKYCSAFCREEADTRGGKEIRVICKHCAVGFLTTNKNRRYCSKQHYIAAKALRSKK